MKLKIAILALTSLFAAGYAHADMDFGQTTFELEEKFEAPRGQHEFYKGETFSLSKPIRLGGLFPYEKEAIALALRLSGGQAASLEEQLKDFSMTDGYLTYFSHEPSGRQFVQVGHYPGDNEYGAIVEISVQPEGTRILGVVSKISDGEISAAE